MSREAQVAAQQEVSVLIPDRWRPGEPPAVAVQHLVGAGQFVVRTAIGSCTVSAVNGRLRYWYMNEWIAKPWALRWWRVPGELLLSQHLDGNAITVMFAWCNEWEWGLDVSVNGGRHQNTIFRIDAEHFVGVEGVPRSIVTATLEQLKQRERGIRDVAAVARDPLLTAIAEQLPRQEWITGMQTVRRMRCPRQRLKRTGRSHSRRSCRASQARSRRG